MPKILPFKKADNSEHDFKDCSYFAVDGDIGVAMRDKSMIVLNINNRDIEVQAFGESGVYGRKELAEFLHVALTLVDPDDKWKPQFDMVGLDYKN